MSDQHPTEGEECVKLFDRYAMQRFGDPKPGDIIAWTSDGAAHYGQYGHVELITPKQAQHYRRQTLRHRVRLFLARLADSVRGRK